MKFVINVSPKDSKDFLKMLFVFPVQYKVFLEGKDFCFEGFEKFFVFVKKLPCLTFSWVLAWACGLYTSLGARPFKANSVTQKWAFDSSTTAATASGKSPLPWQTLSSNSSRRRKESGVEEEMRQERPQRSKSPSRTTSSASPW